MLSSLPLAIAIALSPFAIIPAVLIVLAPGARRTGPAFLGGWAAGVALLTGVSSIVGFFGPSDQTPTWAAWARVVVGLFLVVRGVMKWTKRRQPSDPPGWMQGFESATPARALGLGFTLASLNPKVALLALAGGATVGATADTLTQEVVGVLLFTTVASLTVAAPTVAVLTMGARATAPLHKVKTWLDAESTSVMAVVLVVIGAVVAAGGFAAL
jgi:threonine/homoserine/homoserine lactone efflux protein